MLALSLVLPSSPAHGGIEDQFQGLVHAFRSGTAPGALCVADLTGDGHLDVAVANAFSISVPCSVTVLAGDGQGDFRRLHAMAVGAFPIAIAAGDLDGDGIPDLVTANYSSHTISVLTGIGGGAFAPQVSHPCGPKPHDLALTDLGNDGDLDVVVVNHLPGQGSVTVVPANGGGAFGPAQTYPLASLAISLDVADVHGDGYPDVLVANGNDVGVMAGNPDGTLAPMILIYPPTGARSVTVGNLNSDPWPDLVSCSFVNTISTMLGTAGGYFQHVQTLPAARDLADAAIGDLDGDGNADVVVIGRTDECVQVFGGLGDGRLALRSTVGVPPVPGGIEIANLTPDGSPDLVVSADVSGLVGAILNDGQGGMGESLEFEVDSDPRVLVAADLDADGDLDLASGNAAYGTVSVLPGLGDGSFATRSDHPVLPGTRDLASADFNGDGLLDLVSVNHTPVDIHLSASLTVLLAQPGGGFTALPAESIGTGILEVRPGRFNDDPHPDLMLSGWCVYTMLGRGDGTFDSPQPQDLRATNAALGDLDGDGLDDLVITVWPQCTWVDEHSGQCYWWEPSEFYVRHSTGDTFAPAVHSTYPEVYSELRLVDVNGDALLDLVGAAESGIVVLPGTGTSTFGAPIRSPLPGRYDRITFGDLDQDGALDAVVNYPLDGHLHHRTRFVGLLRGDGAGRFEVSERLFAFGTAITSTVVGDFDSDSWPDLAVTTSRNTVVLMPNRGDAPTSVLVALAVASSSGDRVRLVWQVDESVTVRGVQRRIGAEWTDVGTPPTVVHGVCRFEEHGLGAGTHAYRLAYAGSDGAPRWTDEVVVSVAGIDLAVETITPNPVGASGMVVRFVLPLPRPARLEVFDLQGRRYTSRALEPTPGRSSARIPDTRWRPGVYVLRLSQAGRTVTRNFAVVR